MKKFLLCFLCLFAIVSCVSNPNKFTDIEKQRALSNGKAVINIEWNYHENQLYTIWFNKDDLKKDYIPFHWFTGNNRLPENGPTEKNRYLVNSSSSASTRTFIVEPGEYVLWGIQNQLITPFSRAGHGWYQFHKDMGKSVKNINKNLSSNDFFVVFTVKAGEELTLPRVELIYDNINYTNPDNNADKSQFVIKVFNDVKKIYKFGNKFNVIIDNTEISNQ